MIGDAANARRLTRLYADTNGNGYSRFGVILSHLRLIKQAYVSGDEMALFLEDDIAPFLVPMWTQSVSEIVDLVAKHDPGWSTIQLGYFWKSEWGVPTENIAGRVHRTPFVIGACAYLMSRRGMERAMDMWFTNRTAEAVAVPVENGWSSIDDDSWFIKAFHDDNYIVYPAMFVTHEAETNQGGEDRLAHHRNMNAHMWVQVIKSFQKEFYNELL
jgi:hypothetical protein